MKLELTWGDVCARADRLAREISQTFRSRVDVRLYGVPRGGNYAALALSGSLSRLGRPLASFLVDDVNLADVIVDDIVDSGATRTRYAAFNKPFYALVDKLQEQQRDWVVFPWESSSDGEAQGPTENVRRLLEFLGEDPNREGLVKTPERVIKSYQELFSGYGKRVEDVMTAVFEDGACDEMIVMQGIEFQSMCEHHMLPFFGRAHIAYIPDGKVLGASKLVRVLEVFSRRLQIQERLCTQVTAALMKHLNPKGAACVLEAKHLCMVSRGVQKQDSVMITSSLEGVFRSKSEVRAEFFAAVQHAR